MSTMRGGGGWCVFVVWEECAGVGCVCMYGWEECGGTVVGEAVVLICGVQFVFVDILFCVRLDFVGIRPACSHICCLGIVGIARLCRTQVGRMDSNSCNRVLLVYIQSNKSSVLY